MLSGLISQESVAFWQKNLTGFLNSLVLTTCLKVGRFWNGYSKISLKLPDSYKKMAHKGYLLTCKLHYDYILESN